MHATVIPMDGERALADHTVVLEDGTIQQLDFDHRVSIGPARVVDCTGLYVLPGLGDMYTHYWDPVDAPLYLAHGITTVRTVGTPFQLAMERIAERGEFPSPRMVTLSPPIDGLGPDGRTDMPRGVAMTQPAQAEPLVQRFVRGGYRQIKAFSLLTAENLQALRRAAQAAGVRVSANCPNALTFEEAVEAGVTCFDQLHNVARGHLRRDAPQPEFWDRFDPAPGTRLDFAAIRRLARFLAERHIWNVPTLVFHQRDGLSPAEGLADPALKYVPPSSIKDWESTLVRWTRRARMSDVNEWRGAARERARAFLQVVAIFHEEGVPLLAGTDALNPWNVPGASLHQELANFVAAGMSPYQALRCATIETARFLGLGESGTVAAGKRADLVLLRANPMREIAALSEVEAVCVNGYFLPRAELDRMLAQRAALASSPPKLPAISLPERTASPLNEGTWTERIVGAEAGRIAWRHTRLADDGWLIEECHVSAMPRRHVERRSTLIRLDAQLRLETCAYIIDSFAGREIGQITRPAPQKYAVHVKEMDGWESERSVLADALFPSERLSLSFWPLLLSNQPPSVVRVLDTDAAREMTLTRKDGQWQLKVPRPTQTTEQSWRLAPDGSFLRMQETMPLLWLREVIPAS